MKTNTPHINHQHQCPPINKNRPAVPWVQWCYLYTRDNRQSYQQRLVGSCSQSLCTYIALLCAYFNYMHVHHNGRYFLSIHDAYIYIYIYRGVYPMGGMTRVASSKFQGGNEKNCGALTQPQECECES
jgi:hypothetical protein